MFAALGSSFLLPFSFLTLCPQDGATGGTRHSYALAILISRWDLISCTSHTRTSHTHITARNSRKDEKENDRNSEDLTLFLRKWPLLPPFPLLSNSKSPIGGIDSHIFPADLLFILISFHLPHRSLNLILLRAHLLFSCS